MRLRELQQLAAAMAHEVRNPLNSMAIHVELLEGRLRREGGSEAALKSTAVLAQEIERVDRILEEYLQYAGPSETQRQTIEARVLLAGVVERGRAAGAARRVQLELRTDGELGSWAIDVEGVAEALDALVANAVEASPEGGLVTVAARRDQDQAEVSIADQGSGIAEADRPQLFRVGFSRRGRPGIGLAVAKQIIKGHGGSIGVQHSEPHGSLFAARFPVDNDA
jgi:signal transduction histidine kinase